MGQLLSRSSLKPYDKETIDYFKTKELKDLSESLEIIQQDYEHASYLTYSQFDDIFMGLLNDCEPFFLSLQSDHDINKTVDLYESLAAFAIFSGSSMDEKIDFIFQLFDFDKSGTLELPELVLTLQAAIRGLCKYVYLPIPALKDIEDIALSIFLLIDHDNNKHISLSEFKTWVVNNYELQDFLLKYTGAQTIENLRRRVDVFLSVYKFYFDNAAGGPGNNVCLAATLKPLLLKDNKSIPESDYDYFLQMLVDTSAYDHDPTNIQNIYKDVFELGARVWCSFSGADGDNGNNISTKEFPNLIWIVEGNKPEEIRLQKEMKKIDSNGSGFIDRKEWMTHFSSNDKKTGKLILRVKLRALYDKYADLISGDITLLGLKDLMWDIYSGYIKKTTTEEDKKDLRTMVDDLAKSCMEVVDTGGNQTLEWEEFKDFMDLTRDKQLQFKSYLEKNFA